MKCIHEAIDSAAEVCLTSSFVHMHFVIHIVKSLSGHEQRSDIARGHLTICSSTPTQPCNKGQICFSTWSKLGVINL